MVRLGVSGHRRYAGHSSREVRSILRERLKSKQNSVLVNVGGAIGFDRDVSLVCSELGIQYLMYLPFRGFTSRWSKKDREIFNDVLLPNAYEVNYLRDTVPNSGRMRQAYFARNREIVDNSDALLCYYIHRDSGTGMSVNYAVRRKLTIFNVVEWLRLQDQEG